MGYLLLVEDDPKVRQTIADLLTAAGYHVVSTFGAEEADKLFAYYQSGPTKITTAILDRDVTGGDGFEMARRYRQSNPELNVVIISGFFHPDTTPKSEFKLLPKPFTLETLVEIIKRPEKRQAGGS